MAKGEARYRLILDGKDFENGLKSAGGLWHDFISGMGVGAGINVAESLGEGIREVAGFIPEATSRLAEFGHEMVNASAKSGLTTAALQALKFEGIESGVSVETMTKGFGKFQKAMVEGGKETGAALEKIGLSFNELRAMTPDQQLNAISEGFGKITDPTLRSYEAMKLFGKSGIELLPMLGHSLEETKAHAEALGITLSENTLRAAHDLSAEGGQLQAVFGGITNHLVAVIAESEPVHVMMQGLIQGFGDLSVWVNKNKDVLDQWVTAGVVFVVNAASSAIDVFEGMMASVKALSDVWSYGVRAAQDFAAGVVFLKEAVTVSPEILSDAWTKYNNTLRDNDVQLQRSIAEHDKALTTAIGVTQRVKGVVDDLARSVEASAGKHHVAAEAVKNHTQSYDELSKAATEDAKAEEKRQKIEMDSEKISAEIAKERAEIHASELTGIDGVIAKIEAEMTKRREDISLNKEFNATQKALHLSEIDMLEKEKIAHAEKIDRMHEEEAVRKQILANHVADFRQEFEMERKLEEDRKAQLESIMGDLKAVQSMFTDVGISATSMGGQIVGGLIAGQQALIEFQNAQTGVQQAAAIGHGAAGVYQSGSVVGGAATGLSMGLQMGGGNPLIAAGGAVVGAALGFFGGKHNDKKALDEITATLKGEFAGGIEEAQRRAESLGLSLASAFDSSKPKEVQAAVDQLHDAMGKQEDRLKGLGQAADGLSKLTAGFIHEIEGNFEMVDASGKRTSVTLAEVAKHTQDWKDGVASARSETLMMNAATEQQQQEFNRLGLYASTTFAGMVKETGDVIGALRAIDPTLKSLGEAQTQLGFESDAALQSLMRMSNVVGVNHELGDSIQGLNEMMGGLGQAGIRNQQLFQAFGQDATNLFGQITAGGATGNEALALMQPTLQKLWEQEHDFGYVADESTQSLIDQGVASGQVGEGMRDINRQVLDVLVAIGRVLGADLPESLGKMAHASADASGTVQAGWDSTAHGIADAMAGALPTATQAVEDFASASEAALGAAAGQAGAIGYNLNKIPRQVDVEVNIHENNTGNPIHPNNNNNNDNGEEPEGHAFMGYVPRTTGGQVWSLGEGAEGEWVVPDSKKRAAADAWGGGNGETAEALRNLSAQMEMLPYHLARSVRYAVQTAQ